MPIPLLSRSPSREPISSMTIFRSLALYYCDITREMFKDCLIQQLQAYMEPLVADEMLMASITDVENRNTLTCLKLKAYHAYYQPVSDL